jgi:hypothetical protein
MAAERISEAAAHGYSSKAERAARRRLIARKAGLASGRARRKTCDPGKRRVSQRELALNFRVKLIGRAEFEERERAWREQRGLRPSSRGLETSWVHYRCRTRLYKAKGQGFCTTNGQSAQAITQAGRARCERTMRRQDAKLAEMGLLKRFHDRRGGSGRRAGSLKDRLRIQFTPSFVPPPSAAAALTTSSSNAAALPPKRGDLQGCPAADTNGAPAGAPPGAGRGACAAPQRPGRDECKEGSNDGAGHGPPGMRPDALVGTDLLTGRMAQLALEWGYAASGGSS